MAPAWTSASPLRLVRRPAEEASRSHALVTAGVCERGSPLAAAGIPAQSDWEGVRVSRFARSRPLHRRAVTFPQVRKAYEALDGHSAIRP